MNFLYHENAILYIKCIYVVLWLLGQGADVFAFRGSSCSSHSTHTGRENAACGEFTGCLVVGIGLHQSVPRLAASG